MVDYSEVQPQALSHKQFSVGNSFLDIGLVARAQPLSLKNAFSL